LLDVVPFSYVDKESTHIHRREHIGVFGLDIFSRLVDNSNDKGKAKNSGYRHIIKAILKVICPKSHLDKILSVK
jgi:hypothetical protein